jgi:predicted nucleic acid-binding protein
VKLALDAGFAMAWLVRESASRAVDEFDTRLSAGTLELHAPELFLADAANVLWKTVRRGFRTLDEGVSMFANLSEMPITLHSHRGLVASALDLSMRRGIPAYDALYVALAVRDGLPLFTADARLGRAVSDLVEVVTA